MPALLSRDDRPLTDKAGNALKTGQTVTEDTFGEHGLVRGTDPLDKCEDVNIVIERLSE